MKFIQFFVLTVVCLVIHFSGKTQVYKLPNHPRVFVTAADIPKLKANLNHKDLAEIKKQFAVFVDYPTTGVSTTGKPDENLRNKIECLAFKYLIDTVNEKKAGQLAIQLLQSYLPTITDTKDYHDNAKAYWAVLTGALVYDWCYSLLNTETKTTLIKLMKEAACKCEYCLFKNSPKQYLSGHYGEYAPTAYIAMGLAIYNEDTSVFNAVYKEQVNNFAPSRNPWYEAGTHHQGSQYLHVRYGNEILQAYLLDKVGLNPYSPKIGSVAYREMYAKIPQNIDMDGMPEGDCHNHISLGDEYMEFLPLAANMANDGYLQTYSKMQINTLKEIPVRALLFYNPHIPCKTLDSLSLTKFFPSPSGIMIARTKWDLDKKGFQSNAMVVLMNMREYTTKNHVHLDVGHFSIYYKGHLGLDAGIYQGKDDDNGWGKTNYVNYYSRTIAHNSLLIVDPNEPTPYEGSNKKAISRDGGQFSFKNRAYDSIQEMFATGKSAQIEAVSIAKGAVPEYSYLKGDMTQCYNVPSNVANYPAKAKEVKRSFVFLNLKNDKIPGVLIVLDKVVSANPSFKKTWLLHTQNKPEFVKDIITCTNTNNGRGGKLSNKILLPEIYNQQVELVGGKGKEYWVDGKNWGTITQEDAGQWRVELSPKQENLSDNFLNVIQTMDANSNKSPLEVRKSYSKDSAYVAVVIQDRIVVQSLSLQKSDTPIELILPSTKSIYKVLFTDLEVGKWELKTSNQKHKSFIVNSEAGVLYTIVDGDSKILTLDYEK